MSNSGTLPPEGNFPGRIPDESAADYVQRVNVTVSRPHWEYRTLPLSGNFIDRLNELGTDGWQGCIRYKDRVTQKEMLLLIREVFDESNAE